MSVMGANASTADSERKKCSLASAVYFGNIKDITIPKITEFNKLPDDVDPLTLSGLLLNVCAGVRQIGAARFIKEFTKFLIEQTQDTDKNQFENALEAIPGIIGIYLEPRQPEVPEYYHSVTSCRRPGRQAAKRENRTCGCGTTRMMMFFGSEDSESSAGLVLDYILDKPGVKFMMKDITKEWRNPDQVLSDAHMIFRELDQDIDEYNRIGINRDQVEQDKIPEVEEDNVIQISVSTTCGDNTTGGDYPDQEEQDTEAERTGGDTDIVMVAELKKTGTQETAATGSPPIPEILVSLPDTAGTSTPAPTDGPAAEPDSVFPHLTPINRNKGATASPDVEEDESDHKGEPEKPSRSAVQTTSEEEAQPERKKAKPKRKSALLNMPTSRRRNSDGSPVPLSADWLAASKQPIAKYGSLPEAAEDLSHGVTGIMADLQRCTQERDKYKNDVEVAERQRDQACQREESVTREFLLLRQQLEVQQATHLAERAEMRDEIVTKGRSINRLEDTIQRQQKEQADLRAALELAKKDNEEQQRNREDIDKRLETARAKLEKSNNDALALRVQLKASLEKQKMLENANKRSVENEQAMKEKIESLEAHIQLIKLDAADAQQELQAKIQQKCDQQVEQEVRTRLGQLQTQMAQKIEELNKEKQKLREVIEDQEKEICDLRNQQQNLPDWQPLIQKEIQKTQKKMVTWQQSIVSDIDKKIEEAYQKGLSQNTGTPGNALQLDGADKTPSMQSPATSEVDDEEIQEQVNKLQKAKKAQKEAPEVPMPGGSNTQAKKADPEMENLRKELEESKRREQALAEENQRVLQEKQREKKQRLQAEKAVQEAEKKRQAAPKPREETLNSRVGDSQTYGRSQSPPRVSGDPVPMRSQESQIDGLSVANKVAYTEILSALEEVEQAREDCIVWKHKINSELTAPTAPQVEQLNNSVIHSLRDFMSRCEETKKCIKEHMNNTYIFKVNKELTDTKIITALGVLKKITDTMKTLIDDIRVKFNEMELGVKQDAGSLLQIPIKPFCGFSGDTTVFEFLKQFDRKMEATRARPLTRLTHLWEHLDISVQLDCVGQQEDLEALRAKLVELYGDVQKVIDQKIAGLLKIQVDSGTLGQKHLDQIKKYRAAILKINEITAEKPELRTKLSGAQNKRAITKPWSGHANMWGKWQTYRQNKKEATKSDDFDWFLTLVDFLTYYVEIVTEDVESYAPNRPPKDNFDKDQAGRKGANKDGDKKPDQKQDQRNNNQGKKADNFQKQPTAKDDGKKTESPNTVKALDSKDVQRCENYNRLVSKPFNPKAPAWIAKANLMKEEAVPCFVCPDGDDHLFFECDTALALTCQQRLDKAKSKRCCFECLLTKCKKESKDKCIYWLGAMPCLECWEKSFSGGNFEAQRIFSVFLCTRHKLLGDDLKLFLTLLRENYPDINLDAINMNMMRGFSRIAKADAKAVEMKEAVRNEFDMKDLDEPCYRNEKHGPCVNLQTGDVLDRKEADKLEKRGEIALVTRPPEQSTLGQCFIQTVKIGDSHTTVFYDTGAQSGAITPEVVKAVGATKTEDRNRLVIMANNERYYTNMGTYVLSVGPYKDFDNQKQQKNVQNYCTITAMGFEQISDSVPYTVWDPATERIEKYKRFRDQIKDEKKPEVTLDLPIGLLIGMTNPELMPRVMFTTPCGIMVAKTAIPDHDGSYLIYGGCPEIYWELGLSFKNKGTRPVGSNAIRLAMQARAAVYRDSVQGNSGHGLYTISEMEEQDGAYREGSQFDEATTDLLTNLIRKALLENNLVKEVMTERTTQNNVGNRIDVITTGRDNRRTTAEHTAQNFYTGDGIQYEGKGLKVPSENGQPSGKYTCRIVSQSSSPQQLKEHISPIVSPTTTAGAEIQQDRSTTPIPPREDQQHDEVNTTTSSGGVISAVGTKGKSAEEFSRSTEIQHRQGATPGSSKEAQLHSTNSTKSSGGVVTAAQKPTRRSAGEPGKGAETQQDQSTSQRPSEEAQLHSTNSTNSSGGVVTAAQKPTRRSAEEPGKGTQSQDRGAKPNPPREAQQQDGVNITNSSDGVISAVGTTGKSAGEPSTGVRTAGVDTNPEPSSQSTLQSSQHSSVNQDTAADAADNSDGNPVQNTGNKAGQSTCKEQLDKTEDSSKNSTPVTDTGQERHEVTPADIAGGRLHCFHCAMFSPEEQCQCADDAKPGEMVVCHCEEDLDQQIQMLTWSEELPIIDDLPVGIRKKLKQEIRQYEDWETTGLGVEYRCPRCQQCPDCKAGGHRNKTILEEKEQAIIEESITLDYENKRTYVKFPFISDPTTLKEKWKKDSNRDQAMAILQTQLNKSKEDREQMHEFWKDFEERGYVVEYDKLSPEVKTKIKTAPINHYYVWRAVWKEASASTPCRMVVDPRLSGLNSKLARGRNNLNDLYSLLLDFRLHEHAAAMDVKKMYNSMHVVEDDYCYSLILFPDNMSPDGKIKTYVLTRAMYGVISSGNQAETAIRRAAREHLEQYPLGGQLIQYKMYVDDAADARDTVEERDGAIQETTEVLAKIGFDIKCVTKSGEKPHEKATTNGRTAGLVGLEWDSEQDKLALSWREVNFNKKNRGKKQPNKHPVVTGDDIDDDILPKTWTRRICVSKALETYDPLGIFEPIKAKLKMDMSKLVEFGWDDPIPESYVEVWILNIRLIQDLRHVEVPRCMVPTLATDTKVRILIVTDASQTMAACTAYAGYPQPDGNFSCFLLTAKSKTVKETVPRNELQGCLMGSELCYTIKRAYKGVISEIIHATDSSVSMSWLHEERKVLKQWAYNRVAQVRRLCWDTCEYRHVPGTLNTADLATKGEATRTDMVGPDSVWAKGYEWMTVPTEKLPEHNVVTYENFHMSKEDKRLAKEEEYDSLVEFSCGVEDYQDSDSEPESQTNTDIDSEPEPVPPDKFFEVFKKEYEALKPTQEPPGTNRSQTVAGLGMAKAPKLKLPQLKVDVIKFGWMKAVRTMSLVITFVIKFRRRFLKRKGLDETKEDWLAKVDQEHLLRLQSNSAMTGIEVPKRANAALTEREARLILGWTFAYHLRSASKGLMKELKNKEEYVEVSGIVYYGGRMATPIMIQDQDLDCKCLYDAYEIDKLAPVIVADSPVAYAISMFFHWFLHQHRGAKSSSALLDNDVLIINGATLMKSIKAKCTVCIKQAHVTMKKKMAELSTHQFQPAPPFYSCQMDIAYGFKVQGVNKRTTAKGYALVIVCTTTSAVRIWTLEDITVGAVLLALERHAAVHGYPKNLLIDSGTQLMRLQEIGIQYQDLTMKLMESKYNVTVSAVQDHEARGKVERYIREIRRVLNTSFENVEKQSAIQWETTFAQVSNFLNNTPLYARGNPDLPSLVTPNRLLMGRNNYRVPVGDMVELPPQQMLDRHNKITRMILKTIIENQTSLMHRAKWTKDDKEPEIGDIVMFTLVENDVRQDWKLGKITARIKSDHNDGIVFEVTYVSNNSNHKTTRRCQRDLVMVIRINEPEYNSRAHLKELFPD